MLKLEADLPDTRPFFERYFSLPAAQLGTCLIVALLFRAATFGDPAIHIDEEWYFLVGQWMHEGAVPYVDVWDRKPYLLFALYQVFAAISDSVLSYQLAAWAFAGMTAFIVARICSRWTSPQGAVLAGACYLALLNIFDGIGGQTPVFYNLLIATGAYAIVSSARKLSNGKIPLRIYGAMFLCGLAIQIKQTTLFEAAFFGIWIVLLLWQSGKPVPWGKIGLLALLGASATICIGLLYFASGHWEPYWHAMVLSNLTKQSATQLQYVGRIIVILLRGWLIFAILFLAFKVGFRGAEVQPYRRFLAWWLIAATIGFISVPNLYEHYMLPVAVPAAVIAAVELDRRMVGLVWAFLLIVMALLSSEAYAFSRHRTNAANMEELSTMIAAHAPRDTLLVFDGPPLLFTMSNTRTLTPLAFPNHLNHRIERDVSQFSTRAELERVLGQMPGAVVLSDKPRVRLFDRENRALVQRYISEHCRLIGSRTIREIRREDRIEVYGDCAQPDPWPLPR